MNLGSATSGLEVPGRVGLGGREGSVEGEGFVRNLAGGWGAGGRGPEAYIRVGEAAPGFAARRTRRGAPAPVSVPVRLLILQPATQIQTFKNHTQEVPNNLTKYSSRSIVQSWRDQG